MSEDADFGFGPSVEKEGIRLRIWAPGKSAVVAVLGDGSHMQMHREKHGFWRSDGCIRSGERYGYMLDGRGPFPDPASRSQPEGVDGLSEAVDGGGYSWKAEGWKGMELKDIILEEVHIGTFTADGTFAAAEERLGDLASAGISAVEIMPVGQFHGARNWGYDGTFIYAPQNSYGRPEDLKHLVDAVHMSGMDAILDVVYNHIGPVGNYLPEFGPFFSDKYLTPWGRGLNYDGQSSGPVREFALRNALYWLDEFRFDGLRLDAIHGIVDTSPSHLLAEMSRRVDRLGAERGRRFLLIAESELNDSRVVKGREECGYGLDAQWNDDFHHAVHTYLTGEHDSYYSDFSGRADIVTSLRDGFVYSGRYSENLSKNRGAPWGGLPFERLVACVQNHDQVGNRAYGERMTALADPGKCRFAASLLLLSPFTPMLFMGEEYGEKAPFLFFVDPPDSGTARRVYEGRMKEFERFGWTDTPDPSLPGTFMKSKLTWKGEGADEYRALYRELAGLRRRYVAGSGGHSVEQDGGYLRIAYGSFSVHVSLSETETRELKDEGSMLFNSEARRFGGSADQGSRRLVPYSVAATVQ